MVKRGEQVVVQAQWAQDGATARATSAYPACLLLSLVPHPLSVELNALVSEILHDDFGTIPESFEKIF